MTDKAPLIVIIGATASGKSSVAMEVAARLHGEILSVDSMQVYRHLNIGTAKPTDAEQSQVRHHLINLVEPNEQFAVAAFVEQADAVIKNAAARGVPLIATGGTPLYYKALFEGLFAGPAADEAVRDRLRSLDQDQLHAQLMAVDPLAAARIHRNDTKRLIRALEVFELLGKPISSLQTEWGAANFRHDAKWFGLNWEKEALNRRINARVKQMIEAGWLEETRAVLERFGSLSMTAGEATGYAQLIEYLKGNLSLEDAIEQIKMSTRQLARRQIKWFRRFPNVTWLDGELSTTQLADAILA